ncbi:MAG: hypothetical protein UX81_C0005G0008 [Parcubacteria group bacterium GW2011_GWA2_47_12]|nr:MAG: hypothetical protein UX81_C0005G0008 [Parcubacteria group bacterium GW2011_GWA2_47_12]
MFILKKILYIISGGVALLAVGIFIGAQYSGVLKNIRLFSYSRELESRFFVFFHIFTVVRYTVAHVAFYRHRQDATRPHYSITNTNSPSIPFEFTVQLPPPRKQRLIVQRDFLGRIENSVPPPAYEMEKA